MSVYKNTDGHLGEKCDMCGGYGFMLTPLSGGSAGCLHCNQTGIKHPSALELQKQILELQKKLAEINT